jgi:galactose-1-phosphate uridylyltransferase
LYYVYGKWNFNGKIAEEEKASGARVLPSLHLNLPLCGYLRLLNVEFGIPTRERVNKRNLKTQNRFAAFTFDF